VNVTTPASTSDYVWFGAPGQSQYFASIELLTGSLGSSVRLPYVPNSMLMGSARRQPFLRFGPSVDVYSTGNNGATRTDNGAPGVVLAAAPNGTALLINDQARHVFYLYQTTTGNSTSFGGMGEAAAWTPDSKTLYIVDNAELNTPSTCSALNITGHSDMLYVYNLNTSWSTYKLPPSPLPPGAQPDCDTQRIRLPQPHCKLRPSPFPAWAHILRGFPRSPIPGALPERRAMPPASSTIPWAIRSTCRLTYWLHPTTAATFSAPTLAGSGINLYDIGVTIPTTACSVTTTGSGVSQVQTLNPLPSATPLAPSTPSR